MIALPATFGARTTDRGVLSMPKCARLVLSLGSNVESSGSGLVTSKQRPPSNCEAQKQNHDVRHQIDVKKPMESIQQPRMATRPTVHNQNRKDLIRIIISSIPLAMFLADELAPCHVPVRIWTSIPRSQLVRPRSVTEISPRSCPCIKKWIILVMRSWQENTFVVPGFREPCP